MIRERVKKAAEECLRSVLRVHREFERDLVLRPNHGSKVFVQGYSFSLGADLELGQKCTLHRTLQPNAMIRPRRMVTNVSEPNFVHLSSVQIASCGSSRLTRLGLAKGEEAGKTTPKYGTAKRHEFYAI
jgi:hypothetical protein